MKKIIIFFLIFLEIIFINKILSRVQSLYSDYNRLAIVDEFIVNDERLAIINIQLESGAESEAFRSYQIQTIETMVTLRKYKEAFIVVIEFSQNFLIFIFLLYFFHFFSWIFFIFFPEFSLNFRKFFI